MESYKRRMCACTYNTRETLKLRSETKTSRPSRWSTGTDARNPAVAEEAPALKTEGSVHYAHTICCCRAHKAVRPYAASAMAAVLF